jgi:hypothetical protein
MIEAYIMTDDGLEYRGSCTINGDVQDVPDEAGENPIIELIASDLEDLSVNEVLRLHGGPHTVAVDAREPDEIPDAERERIQEQEARQEIERMADSDQIEKSDGFRLLKSHREPYPIRDVIFAAVDVYDDAWVEQMRAKCGSDGEIRRYIAQSDRVDEVLAAIEQSE